MRDFVNFLKVLVFQFSAARGSYLAATIAYYAFFSLFPLVLLLITGASFLFDLPAVREGVVESLEGLIPGLSRAVEENIRLVIAGRGAVGLAGLLVLIWSGMAVFSALEYGLDKVWRVTVSRPLLKSKLLALLFVAMLGVLLVLSIVFTYLVPVAERLAIFLGVQGPLSAVWGFTSASLGVMCIALFFFLIYRLVPHRKLEWRDVWLGTLLATFGWEAVRYLFGWYITRLSRLSLVYGSMWAIIGMLTWFYITAMTLLLAAQVDYVRKEGSGSSEADN